MRVALLVAIAASVAACGEARNETKVAPPDADVEAAPEGSRGAIDGREFSAIEIDAMRPAFEKDTVIKLNAIVRRSLDTANAYTAEIRAIRAAVAADADGADAETKAAAQDGLEKLDAWYAEALSAQHDMNGAVAELEESGEDYSEEILAGMVQYVNDVERLLREEIAALTPR